MLIETAHFRVHSPRSYQSKWCTDSRIALRLLAYRPRDSGQFRRFRGKEILGAELYQSASLADVPAKFLSLMSPLVVRTSGDSPSVGIQARERATLAIVFFIRVPPLPC